jgi:hypothetical protein
MCSGILKEAITIYIMSNSSLVWRSFAERFDITLENSPIIVPKIIVPITTVIVATPISRLDCG